MILIQFLVYPFRQDIVLKFELQIYDERPATLAIKKYQETFTSEALDQVLKYLDDQKPSYVQQYKDKMSMSNSFTISGAQKILKAKTQMGIDEPQLVQAHKTKKPPAGRYN